MFLPQGIRQPPVSSYRRSAGGTGAGLAPELHSVFQWHHVNLAVGVQLTGINVSEAKENPQRGNFIPFPFALRPAGAKPQPKA